MSRNTKEVALIQHRSGNLAEMPKALHQAEIGLAKDANRLFIGNSVNTILANRTEFPYQNLEILTEYSDLRDHFRYAYENNITKVENAQVSRDKLKEFKPIIVTCVEAFPSEGLPYAGTIEINNTPIELSQGDSLETVISKINVKSSDTSTYATYIQTNPSLYLTFICMGSDLIINDSVGTIVENILKLPTELTYDISMPERKVTEKLDDFLNITDFGIKGDRTNNSQAIFNSLSEIYKNYDDPQFYRNVLFPAGIYNYNLKQIEHYELNSISTLAPFPVLSNLHIHGEGIDRTILHSDILDSTYYFVCGVDNSLNPETNASYGTNGFPNNIVIEDVTFESDSSSLCHLTSVSNVTFNRVKFKSNSSNTKLVELDGTVENKTLNVTFNECIFEGGSCGILVKKYAENINITNCTFRNIKSNAFVIGDEDCGVNELVRAVNINGNIITGTPNVEQSSSTQSFAVKICKNATFVSMHQTQFEESLFNNWTNNLYPIPYFESTNNPNARNFIDTLDPRTDTKKVLKFHFSQPKWEYLDYLINQAGQVVLAIDKNDEDITAPNGLVIKESATDLDIRAVGLNPGNVKISIDNDSDLILGEGTEEGDVTGNIQIKKSLVLNDNIITNESGNEDVTITTSPGKVIVVDETGDRPYEIEINDIPDALTNVAFVNKQIIDTFEKVITYKDLDELENGELSLIDFDPDIYGKNVYLKKIVLNVRTPFYKTYEFLGKAVSYVAGHTYYAGDIVNSTISGPDKYAVVKTTHVAKDSNILTNINVQVIDDNGPYDDIKFANVINGDKILTQSYAENYYDVENYISQYVDIQANNRFGYINCEEFDESKYYQFDYKKMLQYCDRNYVLYEIEDQRRLDAAELHDTTKAIRKYDEGYCYTFEMDRNTSFDMVNVVNDATKNYSGEELKLAFYDKNKIQMYEKDIVEPDPEHEGQTIITHHKNLFTNAQLNPGGKLLVRIEFLREKVEDSSIPEESSGD